MRGLKEKIQEKKALIFIISGVLFSILVACIIITNHEEMVHYALVPNQVKESTLSIPKCFTEQSENIEKIEDVIKNFNLDESKITITLSNLSNLLKKFVKNEECESGSENIHVHNLDGVEVSPVESDHKLSDTSLQSGYRRNPLFTMLSVRNDDTVLPNADSSVGDDITHSIPDISNADIKPTTASKNPKLLFYNEWEAFIVFNEVTPSRNH